MGMSDLLSTFPQQRAHWLLRPRVMNDLHLYLSEWEASPTDAALSQRCFLLNDAEALEDEASAELRCANCGRAH